MMRVGASRARSHADGIRTVYLGRKRYLHAPSDLTATFAQPAWHELLYVLPSAPHTG